MTKGEAVWRIIPELREYIETNILPLYKAHDTAHGPEHVRVVLENSLALLDGLDVDPNMVYTVAAYHDVGLRVSREEHETVSGQWLGRTKAWSAGSPPNSGRPCVKR